MKDICTSFMLYNNNYRGRLMRLDSVIKEINSRHQYPLPIAHLTAEATTLAAILASSLKYDGLFTLQTKSDGPVSQVVVDVTSEGNIRACTSFDEERLNKAQALRKTSGEVEPAPYLMGGGHLAFTVDQGKDTELYQGIVELKGKTFADLVLKYFTNSEQIETYIKLFTSYEDEWKTACLMIQKMPETTESNPENFNEAKILADSLNVDELFAQNLPNQEVLHRLFHNSDLKVTDEKTYQFKCRCSREKLQTTLSGFSKEDIDSIAENNKIQTKCEFCSSEYIFEKGELITQ
ncbi:MAG: Hsp33 family molecular chaperone HslO [Alphaproteobacteria bacterium]